MGDPGCHGEDDPQPMPFGAAGGSTAAVVLARRCAREMADSKVVAHTAALLPGERSRRPDTARTTTAFDRVIAELDKPPAAVDELVGLFEAHPRLPEA